MKFFKKPIRVGLDFVSDWRCRGFGIALRKVRQGLWHDTEWSVWRHDLNLESVSLADLAEPLKFKVYFLAENPLIQELVEAWPPEMAKYRSGFFEKNVRSRFVKSSICLIARRGDELCGGLWIVPPSTELLNLIEVSDQDIGSINTLFVSSKFRGCGIGSQLLREAIRIAGQNGYKFLISIIEVVRTPSIRAHQRCGFLKSGILHEKSRLFCSKKIWSSHVAVFKNHA